MTTSEHECGECDPCLFLVFKAEEPETHCVDCACIMCIPGA